MHNGFNEARTLKFLINEHQNTLEYKKGPQKCSGVTRYWSSEIWISEVLVPVCSVLGLEQEPDP